MRSDDLATARLLPGVFESPRLLFGPMRDEIDHGFGIAGGRAAWLSRHETTGKRHATILRAGEAEAYQEFELPRLS